MLGRSLARMLVVSLGLTSSLVAADDISSLSDEFNDAASLKNWQSLHKVEGFGANQLKTLAIKDGALVMEPQTCTWYQSYVGPLMYKAVTGDFVITTHVQINDTDRDADDVPGSQYSLGGLMIRAPKPATRKAPGWDEGSQNYVFLSLGHTDSNPPRMQFEVKTTLNSRSDLQVVDANTNTAQIQIARIGDAVFCLYKMGEGAWTVHKRYVRNDLPDTLQVGLVTYADYGKASTFAPDFHNRNALTPTVNSNSRNAGLPFRPDLVARFDYARFAKPSVPSEFAGRSLGDPAQVSDEQVLTFLGERAVVAPKIEAK